MSRPLPLPPPGFDDLSVEEKLDYVQSLWDRIVAHPDEVPVPDWHWGIIEDRLAAHRADPGAASPWDEVREELLDELRSRPRQE
ncbi:MAG TPA: addiction module protein [Thermoanaerobaculia bacterium]|jgi:putative addiction module component (TIGR02574 family)|nr:addiction module protein [Thermoanaerobaculia bacterium]